MRESFRTDRRWMILMVVLSSVFAFESGAQPEVTSYGQFHLQDHQLLWENRYSFRGNEDSIRRQVVPMLKSKLYTFRVFKTERGYKGELKNYTVNCEQYDRKYFNTPRMYWDGKWTGKFIVEIGNDYYRVVVYALAYENMAPSNDRYQGEKLVKGKYIDVVTINEHQALKKSEFHNLALMGTSLTDSFDIRNTGK